MPLDFFGAGTYNVPHYDGRDGGTLPEIWRKNGRREANHRFSQPPEQCIINYYLLSGCTTDWGARAEG